MKASNRHLQEDFIRLYEEGKSIRFIAKQYNVSKNSVSKLIQEKIKLRPKNEINSYKNEIIELYTSGNNPNQISKSLNLNYSGIKRLLIKENLININRMYEHLANDFVKDYNSGLSAEAIALKYDVSHQTVIDYLNYDQIKIRDYKLANRKLEINDKYFDNLNKEKAYCLGQIFALGTIQKVHNSKYLSLSITSSKKSLIKKAIKYFVYNIDNLRFYEDVKSNVSILKISSENIYNKLEEYGIRGDMNIRKNLKKDFFRGYLEVALKVNVKNIRISSNVYKESIINFLTEEINLPINKIQKNRGIFIEDKEAVKLFINYYPEFLEKIKKVNSKKWRNFLIEYNYLKYFDRF